LFFRIAAAYSKLTWPREEVMALPLNSTETSLPPLVDAARIVLGVSNHPEF
jgi:hypothetical protein